MGIKIKNLQTGEFEKFNIPALKGEKGEPGEIEPSEKVDYIGKQHSKLRDTMNANVDYIIKTAIAEFNYLDYEGQHITATNSIEGHAKSAILKGQTLVNVLSYERVGGGGIYTKTDDLITVKSNGEVVWHGVDLGLTQVKENTKYIIMWDSITFSNENFSPSASLIGIRTLSNNTQISSNWVKDKNYAIATVTNDTNIILRIHATQGVAISNTTTIKGLKVFEYQQGMENWDIPYFEGMQSVKMPVLTTTGKNLFKPFRTYTTKGLAFTITDGQLYVDGTATDTVDYYLTTKGSDGGTYDFINNNIPVGTTLTLSNNLGLRNHFGYYLDGVEKDYWANESLAIKSNTSNIRCFVRFQTGQSFSNQPLNIQLEQSTVATSYEPYKSNILSAPEDLELRGIGDMQDTLDLVTGELTQRFHKTTIDENYSWTLDGENNGYLQFGTALTVKGNVEGELKGASNGLPYGTLSGEGSQEQVLVFEHRGWITQLRIMINSSRLETPDVKGFIKYITNNPFELIYAQQPTVKTVDLSDNHVYSYKGTTHYDCSSAEGSLVPTLSVKVPTDTQLTIQEQKATTQTLLIKNMDLQQSVKEVQAMNLAFNTTLYNSFNSIREEVEDIKKHVSTNENLEGSF